MSSRYPRPTTLPASSTTRHVVPVVPWSIARIMSRLRADRDLLEALQLALVDVALLRREQLSAGELALVDRVVELARRQAVADPVDVRVPVLQGQVELLVRLGAGREDDGVDAVDRLRRSRVEVEDRHAVALDPRGPAVQAVRETLAEQTPVQVGHVQRRQRRGEERRPAADE